MTWLERVTPSSMPRLVKQPRDESRAPPRPRVSSLQRDPPGACAEPDFEALVLPHASALYRTAYHLCGNRVEAEDLTQETYLRAYRGLTEFRGDDPRPWLFTILRHAFFDECRRRGRRPVIERDISEISAGNIAAAPSAESEALRHVPGEAIERAFTSLPQDWRLIVLLADVEDLSYREIADVMGVPLGTVMSRLHRARKRLQERLLDSARPSWKQNEKSA